jgi:tetratricopeptide (TPR) repeat protein
MSKKLQHLLHGKAILISMLALCTFGIIAATFAIAGSGSGTNSSAAMEQKQALSSQKQLILDSIAKGDRKAADESFKKLTELDKSDTLAEAVYSVSTEFQYKMWDASRANKGHKFIIENFPNSKYSLLSGVELIRSKLRSGKNADEAVTQWMNTYKNRTEFASELPNSIYLIAQAYSNNKKDSLANPLFQFVASTYPKTLYGTLSQMRIDAINKSFDAADVVADYLISRHRDNPEVEKAIRSLAEYYRTSKEYDRSIHLYTSIIDNYENTDDPVKPYREAIYSYIDMNDVKNARDLIDEMQKTLAGNKELTRANFDIANYFLKTGDSVNGLKLHAYNVKTYTTSLESLWSQAAIVWFHVRAGDEENANIEYAKMLSIYKDEKTLAKEVFQIGDIYVEIGNTTKARELYNQVLTDWPQSEYVLNARAGFIKADIHDGTDATVLEDINDLITDFKDRKELPGTIITFGETYYNEGLNLYKGDCHPGDEIPDSDMQNVKTKFNKSLNIWRNTISAINAKKLSANNSITAEYYHYTGTCYRLLGEYEKAIEYYKMVLDNWPEYASAGGVASIIPTVYERMKQEGLISGDSADKLILDAYKRVVEEYPKSPGAKAAANRIKRYEPQDEEISDPNLMSLMD